MVEKLHVIKHRTVCKVCAAATIAHNCTSTTSANSVGNVENNTQQAIYSGRFGLILFPPLPVDMEGA
jgi:hypothetical protein